MLHIYRSFSSRLQMEGKRLLMRGRVNFSREITEDQAAATESILCLGSVYVSLNHARTMNLS